MLFPIFIAFDIKNIYLCIVFINASICGKLHITYGSRPAFVHSDAGRLFYFTQMNEILNLIKKNMKECMCLILGHKWERLKNKTKYTYKIDYICKRCRTFRD